MSDIATLRPTCALRPIVERYDFALCIDLVHLESLYSVHGQMMSSLQTWQGFVAEGATGSASGIVQFV
jgi:hypothetical protein